MAALVQVLGQSRALELATLAARLTGLQQYARLAQAVGVVEGGPAESAQLLATLMAGMDDACTVQLGADGRSAQVQQLSLRLVRGLEQAARADLVACWVALWTGVLQSQRAFMTVQAVPRDSGLLWTICVDDGA